MRWEERQLSELAIAVRELDDELTTQKIETALYGAAIKQLLEDRNHDRAHDASGREHNWQIKLLILTVFLTELANILINLGAHR